MFRIAIVLAGLVWASTAAACLCLPSKGIPELTAEAALFRSDVVAVMTIRAIREERASPEDEPVLMAEFEPVELFKGGKKAQKIYRAKVLKTTHDRYLQARTGMQWLVYIRGKQPLDFTRCGLSGHVDLKQGEVARLRELAES